MSVIKVTNACKDYRTSAEARKVLINYNMNVHQGEIYALMGASGCGKTTLISCLVETLKLDSGDIEIFGEPIEKLVKISIGYMPQENALINEFTIGEMIWFMGRVYGMSYSMIKERVDFLTDLLELPDPDKLIRNCSGGQQRRVSFALTLIHEPPLLILDEPTVGLDPLLRCKIWDYLIEITRTKNVTVLLSTHYIQEAVQSNHVGLMRNGELIAEESAVNILKLSGGDHLEEAFLKLSEKQERNMREKFLEYQKPKPSTSNSMSTRQKSRGRKKLIVPQSDSKVLYALLTKNTLQLLRNIQFLYVALLLPIIGCYCFHYALGGKIKELTLGIVNNEVSSRNDCCNRSLVSVEVEEFKCHLNKVSCRFIEEVYDGIEHKKFFNTFDEALADVKAGKIVGFIHFSSNFSDHLPLFYDDSIHDYTDYGLVKVYLDQTDLQQSTLVTREIYEAYRRFSEKLMGDCGKSIKAGNIPITYEAAHGTMDFDFRQTVIGGFVLASFFTIAAFNLSSSIVSEKLSGTWNRCLVAGVHPMHFMFAHMAEGFVLFTFQLLVYAAYVLIFLVPSVSANTTWLLMLLIALTGLEGLFFGLLTSIVMRTQLGAFVIAEFSVFVIVFLSGVIWPIEGLSPFLRYIGSALPFTLPTIAFRNVSVKDITLCDPSMYSAIVVQAIYITLEFSLIIFLIKRSSKI